MIFNKGIWIVLFLKQWVVKVTTLLVYVDDMIINEIDVEEITRFQEQLSTKL